jgi:hypothetical protein
MKHGGILTFRKIQSAPIREICGNLHFLFPADRADKRRMKHGGILTFRINPIRAHPRNLQEPAFLFPADRADCCRTAQKKAVPRDGFSSGRLPKRTAHHPHGRRIPSE